MQYIDSILTDGDNYDPEDSDFEKFRNVFRYLACQIFSPKQGRKATKSEKVFVGGIEFAVCFDLWERTYALALICPFSPLNWNNWYLIFFVAVLFKKAKT